ncbi:MAG TPA: hypothetical protein VF845_08165 [Terriglobales bacterium]
MLQHVQLLVEVLGSPADASFPDLGQPLRSMTAIIDIPSRTGNGPAAIQRFQAIHDPRQVFDDRQITPGQLAQHPHTRLAMVDRLQMVAA